MLKKKNTNMDAQGGDERYQETWIKIVNPQPINLAKITDFDELSVVHLLGLDQ